MNKMYFSERPISMVFLTLLTLLLSFSGWQCVVGPAPNEPSHRLKDGVNSLPDGGLRDHSFVDLRDSFEKEQPPDGEPPSMRMTYTDMKPFFTEFCISCHNSSGPLSNIEVYDDPKRGKSVKVFWALALQKVLGKKMPPVPPDALDAIARFKGGVEYFQLWKKAGFPGPSSPPTKPPSDRHKFPDLGRCKGNDPLPARWWRLTDKQIAYSLQDAFGATLRFPKIVFTKNLKDGFSNNARLSTVGSLLVVQLVEIFTKVSQEVIAKVPVFQSCLKAKGSSCVKTLLGRYGKKLWRRPLTSVESSKLLAQFTSLESKITVSTARQTALEFVIERLLLSPHFLYRSELGQPIPGQPGLRKLDSNEAASYLSYLIWQSIPDQGLLDAASKGALGSQEQLKAQITRMLKDPRAKRGIQAMLGDWLRLDGIQTKEKDPALFPEVTPKLRQALSATINKFIENIVWSRSGDLNALFTSTDYFMNQTTAPLYKKSVTGHKIQQVPVSSERRSGLVTTAAFLFAHSGKSSTGFVHRGVFFLEQLACRPLLSAPPGVAAQAKERLKNIDKSKLTQRDIQKIHAKDPNCAFCHKTIDPAGAAFELYDPLGRYRTTERGNQIDASGELKDFGDMKPTFKNGVELMRNLASSKHFRQCFTTKLFTFALGGAPQPQQSCELARVYDYLKGKKFVLKQSYQALLGIKKLLIRKEPGN